MNYLIVFLLCFLATLKVSFQGAFGRKNVRNSADALLFNAFVFIFSSAFFLPSLFGCSSAVWYYGIIAAVFTVLYQFFNTQALSVGSMSLTVLIVNFGMVINVMVSYFVFDEPITIFRFTGILLTLVAFVVCTGFKEKRKSSKMWLFLAIMAMITTSLGSITLKFFGESEYKAESTALVSCFYLISTLLAFVFYFVFKLKGQEKNFKINGKCIGYAAAVGISLALFQFFYTYALGTIDGTFLFPAYTGGTIVLSTISGVIIFKDKLTKRQLVGIVLGITAVTIMNF